MAWRQQVQLLQRLSTASDISEFGKSQKSVHQLCLHVQDWSQGKKGRDCPDLDLLRSAVAAGRNGLQAISDVLKAKRRVEQDTKSCISLLVFLVDNLLCNYVGGGLRRGPTTGLGVAAAGLDSKGHEAGAQPASVSETQTMILKIGFLNPFVETISAIAVTFNEFLRSNGPSFVKAVVQQHSSKGGGKLKHQDATTLSATAPFPLAFVKRLLALWLSIRKLSATHGLLAALAGFGQTASNGMSFGAHFDATIQPICSLLLALLQYESRMGIDFGSVMATVNGKNLAYGVICQVMLTVPVIPKMSQLSWLRPDDASQRSKPAADDSILQHPEVHALLLFTLAAFVHGLHREQKGVSPATLLEPTASRSSDQARKQQKQQLEVQDFAMGVLQDFKLGKAQAQRFWKSYSEEGNHLPQPATLQHLIQIILEHLHSGFEKLVKLPTTSNIVRSQLPVMLHYAVMLLRLLVQLIAVQPAPSEVNNNLGFLRKISAAVFELHEAHGSDRKTASAVKAALAEITDSILAPLVLQVGPAVLYALQQPDCSKKLQSDIQELWYMVVGIFLMGKVHYTGAIGTFYLQAVGTWTAILQQQPATAVTAIELVVRRMAEDKDVDILNMVLVLTGSLLEAIPRNDRQFATVAASDVNSSSQQWNRELAAKPISLFVSCLKLWDTVNKPKEMRNSCFSVLLKL